ncbi:hypothetical protein [Streptomyces sp. NPDC093223]|uniref:hypothetical protein n=1 Tax=Streptomyces sp. NPDC093223 TaxID=3366033 RepID=UPI00380CB827
MDSPARTWSRGFATAAAVTLLALASTACGGSGSQGAGGSSSTGEASTAAGGGQNTGAGETSGGNGGGSDSSGVKYAACMRNNGVDVPDPKPGEQPRIPDGVPQNVLDKAKSKCGQGDEGQTAGGGVKITNAEKFEALRLKFLKCEREHGYTPPNPSNGGAQLDGNDPAYKLASKACKSISDEMRKYTSLGQGG